MKYLAFIFIVSFVLTFLFSFKMLLSMNIESKFKQGKVSDIRFYYFLKSFVYSTIVSLGIILLIYAILKMINVF